MSVNLINIYQILQSRYPHMSGWPDGQWPVSGKFESDLLEIVVGAVLAQNTRWSNVEMALRELVKEGLVDTTSIDSCSAEKLERTIRSSGFYRQKAIYLKKVIRLILDCPDFCQKIGREKLLATKGIGPETADTILLYACHRPFFVVDAYTRRIFFRYGLLREKANYLEIQELFQTHLPLDITLYQKFHALVVEHAKQSCRKTPICVNCALKNQCRYGLQESQVSLNC